ncbi:PhnD/SsuA/transferrin family substrate-binding protein, partial [Kaarinaea lacus]
VFSLQAPAEEKVIHFGAVATSIPASMYQRLLPLSNYLSESIKRPVHLTLSPNMATAIQQTVDGRVDISYLTPMAYIEASKQADVKLLAGSLITGKKTCQLMIVVRQQSNIEQLDDLRGKRFAFGDRASLLQRAVINDAGLKLIHFGEYRYLGHYDNIARAVLNDDFDAGIMRDSMALRWRNKGLRILHTSRDLPTYNITGSEKLDPETARSIRRALLALDITNPHHRKILSAIEPGHEGFIETSDADYNSLRDFVTTHVPGESSKLGE